MPDPRFFPPKCPGCLKPIIYGSQVSTHNGLPHHTRCVGKTPGKPSSHKPKEAPRTLKSKLSYDSLVASESLPTVSHTRVSQLNRRPYDTSQPLITPEGKTYYPYQLRGIRGILSRRNTLLADEMGLGKGPVSIGAINNSPEIQSVLIVCPASLRYNWRVELRNWLVPKPLRIVGLFPEAPLTELDIAIVSFSQLSKIPPDAKFDLLLVDEAHLFKNPDADRTKHGRRIASRCGRLVFLTGSAIENRVEELWTLIQMLDPDTWDPPLIFNGMRVPQSREAGYHRFAIRYCGAEIKTIWRTVNGKKEGKKVFDYTGATNTEELHKRLRATVMIRRLKKDVLPELPDKIREVVVLPPPSSDVVEREHTAFAATGLDYESSIEDLGKASIAFTEWSKVRHEVAQAKLPLVVEHVARLLEHHEKIVVMAHHTDVVNALVDAFEAVGSVPYRGDMPESLRHRSVEKFQTDPHTRVFVGSITAAGVGLTLTAAGMMVFAEVDVKDMRQAEDRIHRVGQTRDVCHYQFLVFDWSVDANMMRKVLEKSRVADAVLDGKERVK